MHAFQIMLPFGTMDPVKSVAIAASIYKQFPMLEKSFQKYNQTMLARIGDGGYNLGTNFPWKKVYSNAKILLTTPCTDISVTDNGVCVYSVINNELYRM